MASLSEVSSAISQGVITWKPHTLWKGAKLSRALEFTSQQRKGYLEKERYCNEVDIWKEERYG